MSIDPTDEKAIEYMLSCAKDHMDRLNDWETGFIESVSDQWERNQELTQTQVDKLEQIHVKLP